LLDNQIYSGFAGSTESAMMLTPGELLDTSLAQLRTLTAFLGDQLRETSSESALYATVEVRACKEILLSLNLLIPKLQAARNAMSGGADDDG
jgi:hypothetical protein